MLKFTKGFVPNNQTKIATNYIKMTPIDRINIIHERQKGITNLEEKKKIEIVENKDIYRDRINALRNIKKD